MSPYLRVVLRLNRITAGPPGQIPVDLRELAEQNRVAWLDSRAEGRLVVSWVRMDGVG